MKDPHEQFEEALKAVQDPDKKGPIIDVLDTAYIVWKWFNAYTPEATAADIVAMTALIMEREEREKRSRRNESSRA